MRAGCGRLLVLFFIPMIALAQDDSPLKTIDDRLAEYGEIVRARLEARFQAAGVTYPPSRVTLIGLKHERLLEVYAPNANGDSRFICSYPVLAASGGPGPKLREGDLQVPEGIYHVRELNPNSRFHLSIWLNYPNEFDCARATEENRTNLGGEIMVHGGAVSKGCLAVGDSAAEDLFILAAVTGINHVTVILAPMDFREQAVPNLSAGTPKWTPKLYEDLRRELALYPRN